MNCDCITKIDARLKEKNLSLAGVAWVGPDYQMTPYITTQWIDSSKAPRGSKKNPPSMFASHCPFCGVPVNKAPNLKPPVPIHESKLSVMDDGTKRVD